MTLHTYLGGAPNAMVRLIRASQLNQLVDSKEEEEEKEGEEEERLAIRSLSRNVICLLMYLYTTFTSLLELLVILLKLP